MELEKNIEILKKEYDKLLNKISKKYNLTLNEMKILLFLYEHQNIDIAKEIVECMKFSKSHVSMSLDSLEKNNYVKKTQDDSNKKKHHLKVTKKADKILEEINKEQDKLRISMFTGITNEEINILNNILEKIRNNLTKL